MVAHYPHATAVEVDNLGSLDLIVGRFNTVQCFAIRCHHPNGNAENTTYLLLGPEFPNDTAEPFLRDYVTGDTVLSYGRDYRFDLDLAPESVHFADAAEHTAGLVVSGDQSYFRFKISPWDKVSRMGLIDLSSGEAIERLPQGPSALITNWGVSVGLGAEEKPIVVIPPP